MKLIALPFAAGAAALLVAALPMSPARAQVTGDPVDASALVTAHGDWTLKDREHWLFSRLDKARDDGSIDDHEFDRVHHEMDRIRADEDRMRGDHDGQLTDNENADLEARLDTVAAQIHWLHDSAFQRPW